MKEDARRLKEHEIEKQREETMRRINELKKQLEELEQAPDQEDEEMQGEEEYEEEEYDDEQWAEYEAQQAEWTWTSQEEDKGTSSKESS